LIDSWQHAAKEAAGEQVPIWKVALIGVALILFGDVAYERYNEYLSNQERSAREAKPAEDFMVFRNIEVVHDGAKTSIKNDPRLFVDREIFVDEPFPADWEAIISTGSHQLLCYANGRSPGYSSKSELPEDLRLFRWWMNIPNDIEAEKACTQWPLPDGEKCLQTWWDMKIPNYPKKTLKSKRFCWDGSEIGAPPR